MHANRHIAVITAVLFCVASCFAAPQQSLSLILEKEPGQLEVKLGAKRVLLYAFAANQIKPYVRELYALNGLNVLRDAPADHLHHHALMYAIRVNGINFWEETGQPGHQRSIKILSHGTGRNARGLPQSSFTHLIHWVAHTNAASDDESLALLIERRTIVTTIDESQGEVALEWRSDFEVGPAAPRVTLTGSAYNGLGLRLPKEFDGVARHQNSEGIPYTADQKWDVTVAKWSAVSASAEGRHACLALFSTPSNKGEPRFFTMLTPFAYLSVTQNLEKQPLDYARGDRFSIRYLLTVYSADEKAGFLSSRYERWLTEVAKATPSNTNP